VGLEPSCHQAGDHILDTGCEGGKNVARILKRAPDGKVCGIDYSEVCVEKNGRLNRTAVRAGRAEVLLGNVPENPLSPIFRRLKAFREI
jgi:trans-aconitate methyltransferase